MRESEIRVNREGGREGGKGVNRDGEWHETEQRVAEYKGRKVEVKRQKEPLENKTKLMVTVY